MFMTFCSYLGCNYEADRRREDNAQDESRNQLARFVESAFDVILIIYYGRCGPVVHMRVLPSSCYQTQMVPP